jgi:hypothetical protein
MQAMWRQLMLVAGMLAAVGLAATAQRFVSPAPTRTYTAEEIEQLVKQDVAQRAHGRADQVTVVSRSPRRFAGGDLCAAAESAPASGDVIGYAFTLRLGQGHYEYGADEQGQLRACRIVRPIE